MDIYMHSAPCLRLDAKLICTYKPSPASNWKKKLVQLRFPLALMSPKLLGGFSDGCIWPLCYISTHTKKTRLYATLVNFRYISRNKALLTDSISPNRKNTCATSISFSEYVAEITGGLFRWIFTCIWPLCYISTHTKKTRLYASLVNFRYISRN